jgi:hypothetical protein
LGLLLDRAPKALASISRPKHTLATLKSHHPMAEDQSIVAFMAQDIGVVLQDVSFIVQAPTIP